MCFHEASLVPLFFMGGIPPPTHYMGWEPEQNDRYATIFAHGIVLNRSQDSAIRWEEGESRIAQMTDAERRHHQLLFDLFVENVGVHPRDRQKLDELMDAEIWAKCQRNLDQIIQEVNDQTSFHVDPPIVWQNWYSNQD